MTYPTRAPSTYLVDAYLDAIEADTVVHDLVFPSWNTTPVSIDDKRIYRSTVNFQRLVDGVNVAVQLPRVMMSAVWSRMLTEQEDLETAAGPVRLYTHCFVPAQYYLHGDVLDMAVARVLLSTVLSDTRIIGSPLAPVGNRLEERESAFNDAWRFTQEYAQANVGALVNE